MSEFEHMKRLLENIGLYAITDNSLIKAELMAYAAGLDTYFTALDELKRECFVATATTYGLQYREDMLRRLMPCSRRFPLPLRTIHWKGWKNFVTALMYTVPFPLTLPL